MRWNGSNLGFTYSDKWHRSTKNLCRQARNSMILCNHFSDVNWNQDEALGNAAHLLFATLRNGSTHAQREYIHKEVGRRLDSPIIWRLSSVGWMESGRVLSFSQRNLMLYRNPVFRMIGEGTTENPDYRIVPENLSHRSCDTRRVFPQPTGMLEQMSDIPLFESDRSEWGKRPHFHGVPAPHERMSDQQAQSMLVVNGSRSTEYTYHLEGGAMAIVFQAQLPHSMTPIMRGPRDTDQPEGHSSDGKSVPGALAPSDEAQTRPGWRTLLERHCTSEARKAAADERRNWKTQKELREEENPPWRPEEEYPLADIQATYQEPQDDVPTMSGHAPVEEPMPEVRTINMIKLEFDRVWHRAAAAVPQRPLEPHSGNAGPTPLETRWHQNRTGPGPLSRATRSLCEPRGYGHRRTQRMCSHTVRARRPQQQRPTKNKHRRGADRKWEHRADSMCFVSAMERSVLT